MTETVAQQAGGGAALAAVAARAVLDGSPVGVLAASVVIPTVGRIELLTACLRSVLACQPGAEDVVVVDQSHGATVAACVASLNDPRVRVVTSDATGIAAAMNEGLRAAQHDVVLTTNDDCTVAADWVDAAWRAYSATPGAIVTGRVLPAGDARFVPSVITTEVPVDWTGVRTKGVLYPTNMAGSRARLLGLGGYDERATFRVAAEDNDLCYRWTKAGFDLRYTPELVVWHHDWRTTAQLRERYREYARGQGAFYAKHLVAGDMFVLRFVVSDLREGMHARLRRLRPSRRHAPPNRRDSLVPGLLVGLAAGAWESWALRGAR